MHISLKHATLATLGWLVLAMAANAVVLQVGPTRKVASLAVASVLAKSGDTVEVDAGTYAADVAIWSQSNLTVRAVGGRVRLMALGAAAEGKGIWVVRGGAMAVQGFDFVGAKVADKNGAGIRFEKGQLSIKDCTFTDNENGILTSGDKDAELLIENSEFGNNGFGDGYSHNLYVGAIKKLTVTGSYFHHAKVGHLLKSRAAENHIFYNRLTDETGGRASYELEFPNGGLAYVVGNHIQQGSQTENPTLISFGAEGYKWPHNELYLVSNVLADDRPSNGKWLAVRTDPGAKPVNLVVKALNNVLVGTGDLGAGMTPPQVAGNGGAVGMGGAAGTGDVAGTRPFVLDIRNNINVDWDVFVQASRQDYRLKNPALPLLTPLPPGTANGVDLTPKREYLHPRQTRGV